jgi:hypothetical protein
MTLLSAAACRGGDGDGTGTTTGGENFDEEALMQVMAEWENQDIAFRSTETVTDARDCEVDKWWFVSPYGYDPNTEKGDGIHLVDLSFPISEIDPSRPRIIMFQLGEQGEYIQVGLEWYYEPPGGEEAEEQPTLFGVAMDGMMDPHIPDRQQVHYDIHAWLWEYTSPDNEFGYFGLVNQGMTFPEWYRDYEGVIFDSFKFFDPGLRVELGYTEDLGCIESSGYALHNPAMKGALDPFMPDTIFVDQNGMWLGSEWTAADDGSGAPTLHGQTMSGPNADGDYYLRSWAGHRMNPNGFFGDTHGAFSCSDPVTPSECL